MFYSRSWVAVLCLFIASTAVAQEFSRPLNQPTVISRGTSQSHGTTRGGFPTLQPITASDSSYRVAGSGELDRDASATEATAPGLPLSPTVESSRSKMTGPLVTVCSSLAIVLALFSGLVWVGRKFGGGAAASKPLPASALAPMGHVMLDPRTKLLLVKCGRRILVLSQTSSGITPLSEITHPDEVREMIANCSAEAREVFQRTLREIEREPARGFTGPPEEPIAAPRREPSRLFATA